MTEQEKYTKLIVNCLISLKSDLDNVIDHAILDDVLCRKAIDTNKLQDSLSYRIQEYLDRINTEQTRRKPG